MSSCLQIWKTLDEVHLISKDRRRKGKQQSSLKEGIDQDALELADTELLLLDDVIKEGGGAVDLLEPHDAFAAIATVASASRHGSTPGRAASSARKGAASTSADLMARTPLSRMGSARSDAGGGTSAFRLGSCQVDDGSGALMMGGQGGAGLLGVAGGSLGLGQDGGMGPGDLRPLAGGSAGAATRGGALSGPGGIVGALSFMDGSATGASPATDRTAHFGAGELAEMGGGMQAGGGFAEYDDHDGGWFGAEQAAAGGGAGPWTGAGGGGEEGALAAARRRKQPRGLAALWAAAAAGDEAGYGDADADADGEEGSAGPSAAAAARDDPWLQLRLEDESDAVLRQARSAGVKGVARPSKARPLRPARTTSTPKSALLVASSGYDEAGGVRIPGAAVAALAPLGAIGSAGVMGSAAALSARLASALGVPVDVSETAAAPALPEMQGYYAAARAAVARARLARAAAPVSRRAAASSAAAAAHGVGGGRVLAGADDDDDDDAEAEAAFDAGDDGDFGGDLPEMGGGVEAGGGFAEYGGGSDEAGGFDGDESDGGRLSARAALFGPGAAGFGSPGRVHGGSGGHSASSGAGAAAAAGSYEAMVARYRDEFLRSAEEEVGTTDMARRVSAWTESVGRALEEEELRGVFDVQAYGRGVMGALAASRAAAAGAGGRGDAGDDDDEEEVEVEVDFGSLLRQGGDFVPTAEGDDEAGLGGGRHAHGGDDEAQEEEGGGHVVKGLGAGPPQVARSFLALLQLANAGNVELVHPEDVDAAAVGSACAELRVRLLHSGSAIAHLDQMGEVAGRAATTKAAMAQASTPPKRTRGRARRGRRDDEDEEAEAEASEEGGEDDSGAPAGAAAAGSRRARSGRAGASRKGGSVAQAPASGGRGRKTSRVHGDTPEAKRTSSRRGAPVFEDEQLQPALLAMEAAAPAPAAAAKPSRTASTASVRSTKRPLAPLSQAEASSRLGRKASAASAVSAAASLLAQGDSDSEADSSDDGIASPEAKAPRVRGTRRAGMRAGKV